MLPFDRVIEHIKTINYYKELHQSQYPILIWQFVVLSHNEHEIEMAQELANQLSMQFKLKLSWDEKIAQVKNPELIRKYLGAATRSEYLQSQGEEYLQKSICSQLWNSPQINWDGQLLGCCYNYWGGFGDVFESTLEDTLNNDQINYARQMLVGDAEPKEGIPCTSCGHYKTMAAHKNWLTEQDIKLDKRKKNVLLRTHLQEIWSKRKSSEESLI